MKNHYVGPEQFFAFDPSGRRQQWASGERNEQAMRLFSNVALLLVLPVVVAVLGNLGTDWVKSWVGNSVRTPTSRPAHVKVNNLPCAVKSARGNPPHSRSQPAGQDQPSATPQPLPHRPRPLLPQTQPAPAAAAPPPRPTPAPAPLPPALAVPEAKPPTPAAASIHFQTGPVYRGTLVEVESGGAVRFVLWLQPQEARARYTPDQIRAIHLADGGKFVWDAHARRWRPR